MQFARDLRNAAYTAASTPGNPASAALANTATILDVLPPGHDGEGHDGDEQLRRLHEEQAKALSSFEEVRERRGMRGCCARLSWLLTTRWSLLSSPTTWVFLITLGVLAAIAGYLVDSSVLLLHSWRQGLLPGDGYNFWAFVLWVLWAVLFSCLAASAGHLITLDAQGSGIPELKAILSGTPALMHYLTPRVMVGKLAGVVSALAAGLSVGKEGPFVHVSAIIASYMCDLPCFTGILRRNPMLRSHMLGASVAAGVTAVFGAPVGGVLFGIEVTATYYLVSNLWRAFVCAVFCVCTYELINAMKEDELFSDTEFDTKVDVSWELMSFSLLGVLCGLLASAFVWAIGRALTVSKTLIKGPRSRYIAAGTVGALGAVLTYSAGYLRKGDHEVINDLFSALHLNNSDSESTADWLQPSIFLTLGVWLGLKFLLTPLALALPIPCGLFTPLFASGAAFGRLFGELLRVMFPQFGIVPGAYAVVGAAALSSGATHTLSTAVIVFELTGQLHHMIPVLVATLLAYSVAGTFTISVYDVLLKMKGIPFLPRVVAGVHTLFAKDVMHADLGGTVKYLTMTATVEDAIAVLEDHSQVWQKRVQEIPVVDSGASMILVGSVTVPRIEAMVRHWRRATGRRASASAVDFAGGGVRTVSATMTAGSAMDVVDLTPQPASDAAVAAEPAGSAGVGGASGSTPVDVTAGVLGVDGDDEKATAALGGTVLPTGPGTLTGAGAGGAPAGASAGTARDDGDSDTRELLGSAGSGNSLMATPHLSRGGGASPMDAAAAQQRLTFVGYTSRTGASEGELVVDPAPFQLGELTPLTKVHFYFAICQFNQAFITKAGRLVGMLLKQDLSDEKRLSAERLNR